MAKFKKPGHAPAPAPEPAESMDAALKHEAELADARAKAGLPDVIAPEHPGWIAEVPPEPVTPATKHASPSAVCPVCGSNWDGSRCVVDGWAGGR